MTSAITVIRSIQEIDLKEAEDGLKILALDFDHNLGISDSLCSSDHFNDFMNHHNIAKGVYFDAHAPLLLKLRNQTKFVPTENGINEFIGNAKKMGWKVVVLTARPKTMQDLTATNIAEAGLTHLKEAPIICEGDKKYALHNWLSSLPEITKIQKIFIRFMDDKKHHCENVLGLSVNTLTLNIRCYHYTSHSTTTILTTSQQKIVVAQLAAFKHKQKMPKDNEVTPETIIKALNEFQLKETDLLEDGKAIYNVVKQFISK